MLALHRDPCNGITNLINQLKQDRRLSKEMGNQSQWNRISVSNRRGSCPPVSLNNQQLPQDDAKYLGLHLDRRLTWKKHIFTKRKQLGLILTKPYWIIGRKSQLSLENKLLMYKMILKPVWSYGIQLWDTASNTNIEILERFQSKTLRIIVNDPYFVPNNVIIMKD